MLETTMNSHGDWGGLLKWLGFNRTAAYAAKVDALGKHVTEALSQATPKRTGKTSRSWRYTVTRRGGNYTIHWYNDNTNEGTSVALLIDRGHLTRDGGYVPGEHFIAPTVKDNYQDEVKAIVDSFLNT